MTEQPGMDSAPVEDRLTAFFAADAGTPETPPEGQAQEVSASDEQPEPATDEQPQEDSPEEESAAGVIEIDGEQYDREYVKSAVHGYKMVGQKSQQATALLEQAHFEQQKLALATQYQQQSRQLNEQIISAKVHYNLATQALQQASSTDDRLAWMVEAQKYEKQLNALIDAGKGLESQAVSAADKLKQDFRERRGKSLAQMVPGWNAQADAEATSAAFSVGFTKAEIEDGFDARLGMLAWKAAQFDKASAGKQGAISKINKAPPVIKPGASQGPNANANRRFNDARVRLKKSGSTEAFAEALLASKLVR